MKKGTKVIMEFKKSDMAFFCCTLFLFGGLILLKGIFGMLILGILWLLSYLYFKKDD